MHLQTYVYAACLLLGTTVLAHPGGHTYPDSGLFAKRSAQAGNCANSVGAMKQKRHQIRKRSETADFTVHAEAPHYDFIKNESCILYPEVTQGPYWYPPSELLLQDMVQGQVGVPLELDIGVINVNTCEPMEDVLISLWHCNATGSYSSFAGNDPNTPFGTLAAEKNLTIGGTFGQDLSALVTDDSTWLRGMWPTDANGATSFNTIFPGFYIGRTLHIHVQVHTNWTITKNGTIDHSRVVETGQIYFDEQLTEEIMAIEPYASHTQIDRVLNDEDGVYAQQVQSGAMNVVDAEPLDGVDFKNGVLAYVTLAIDPTTIKDGSTQPGGGIRTNSTSS